MATNLTVPRSISDPNPASRRPNRYTVPATVSLIKMCKITEEVHQVHGILVKTGLIQEIGVVNALIEFCASSSINLQYAQSVFRITEDPSLFTKNIMLRCHSRSECPPSAVSFYVQLLNEGFQLNRFAFSFLVQACTRSQLNAEGKQIHAQIIKSGEIDSYLASSIVSLYSGRGDLHSAQQAFELSRGVVASWNAIIDGYAKMGEVDVAKKLLEEMPKRSLISWTALMTGYVHSGRYRDALDCFQTMQKEGIRPDEQTLVSVLPSVSRLGALSLGKWIHSYVENAGMEMNVFLGSAMIDMYAKCGSIDSAMELFERIEPSKRNVVTWNAITGGLAMHGRGMEALDMFQDMLRNRVKPTDVTFVGVLKACSHGGMVDEGVKYFKEMEEVHGIKPTMELYGCMVDLLGRAGRLEEAERLVRSMKEQPGLVVLKALLSACKVHRNVDIGERMGLELIELASDDSSCYVLLANLYAQAGRWEDVKSVRNLMRERGLKKIAGCSSIELNDEAHEFHAGDMTHPCTRVIYSKLDEMRQRLEEEGYTPDTTQVLADIEEEEKETALYRHSEKLAIAFGLINTEPGSTIHIIKNLRVCSDCHAATKLVSKLYNREIIVRDQNRFHHFKNGLCSCMDYW
ncbi:pentatricopeptide repeat-containing protein At5g48910-like [Aristolochia californica]|uniref:pentatricopeptide repeat-containing protein At5g48910-like n=1 Tax=Aristolochia californica TaxID=171875 RepID=UPI0035E1F74A